MLCAFYHNFQKLFTERQREAIETKKLNNLTKNRDDSPGMKVEASGRELPFTWY